MTTLTEPSRTNWRNWPKKDRLRLLARARQKRNRVLDFTAYADDLRALARAGWDGLVFYDLQEQILQSVKDNDETVVVAAHQVGKDFVAGFCALWAFLCHPVARVVATSVKDDHLRVLFGEIERFIQTCRWPLTQKQGGPLIVNHRDIRKVGCPVSYLRGMVSERGEGLAGHHAPYTLLIVDEASGVDDMVFERADTWAKRKLIFGNPYACQNYFRRAVKEGDVP